MKTRVISGVVAAALVVALLLVNSYFSITSIIALSILSAIATFEMLSNTNAVKNKSVVIIAMIYSALAVFSHASLLINPTVLTVLYVTIIVFFAVFGGKEFGGESIAMSVSMPIMISFAFTCIGMLINYRDDAGLLYFLLLFNFTCVSDICAYFVGSAVGKHKLAPQISPKKTIEGLVGGLLGSMVGTIVICIVLGLILKTDINILALVLITPIFSILGTVGDLFASKIKRNYGIKDYGNIMPGHGGVLDRTDSILLVAPAFIIFLNFVQVV